MIKAAAIIDVDDVQLGKFYPFEYKFMAGGWYCVIKDSHMALRPIVPEDWVVAHEFPKDPAA